MMFFKFSFVLHSEHLCCWGVLLLRHLSNHCLEHSWNVITFDPTQWCFRQRLLWIRIQHTDAKRAQRSNLWRTVICLPSWLFNNGNKRQQSLLPLLHCGKFACTGRYFHWFLYATPTKTALTLKLKRYIHHNSRTVTFSICLFFFSERADHDNVGEIKLHIN